MTTENQYREGARPRIRGTFTDEDGVAFTPTTHLLTVRPPVGDTVEYTDAATPSGSDPNVLDRRLPAVEVPGRWRYRFEANDGLHFAVDESSFYVHASEVVA